MGLVKNHALTGHGVIRCELNAWQIIQIESRKDVLQPSFCLHTQRLLSWKSDSWQETERCWGRSCSRKMTLLLQRSPPHSVVTSSDHLWTLTWAKIRKQHCQQILNWNRTSRRCSRWSQFVVLDLVSQQVQPGATLHSKTFNGKPSFIIFIVLTVLVRQVVKSKGTSLPASNRASNFFPWALQLAGHDLQPQSELASYVQKTGRQKTTIWSFETL